MPRCPHCDRPLTEATADAGADAPCPHCGKPVAGGAADDAATLPPAGDVSTTLVPGTTGGGTADGGGTVDPAAHVGTADPGGRPDDPRAGAATADPDAAGPDGGGPDGDAEHPAARGTIVTAVPDFESEVGPGGATMVTATPDFDEFDDDGSGDEFGDGDAGSDGGRRTGTGTAVGGRTVLGTIVPDEPRTDRTGRGTESGATDATVLPGDPDADHGGSQTGSYGEDDLRIAELESAVPGSIRRTYNPGKFDSDERKAWREGLAEHLGSEARGKTESNRGGSRRGSARPSRRGSRAGSQRGSRRPGADSALPERTSLAHRQVVGLGRPPQADADYDLLDKLGEGGMGVVWKAEQKSVGRAVALKMLKGDAASPSRRAGLVSEAVVTGDLEHPNIVPIYDLGRDDEDNLFYAMKAVQGDEWVKKLKGMSEADNLDTLLKVCDAIAFAHSRGVVHRDLKPENVLLGEFGQVLVMDWGLAHVTEDFTKKEKVIRDTGMGGSPAYMAPEQAYNFLVSGRFVEGQLKPITTSIDEYLLGAMLWEVATGLPPHAGPDSIACVVAAKENRFRVTERDDELIAIARRAMADEPADRYADVPAFQAAIREYLSHGESRRLTGRGMGHLADGNHARAVASFEDAVALWPGNVEAESRRQQAAAALARRKRANRLLGAGLAAAIVIGVSGVSWQWFRAEGEKDRAVAQQIKAEKQEAIAVAERKEARRQEAIAVAERQKVIDEQAKVIAARDLAEQRRKAAVAAEAVAEQRREEAVAAKVRADEAKLVAETALEGEKKATAAAKAAQLAEVEERKKAVAAADAEKLARAKADEARVAAVAAKKIADEQRVIAEARRREAESERAIQEHQNYSNQVRRIGQYLRDANLGEARTVLAAMASAGFVAPDGRGGYTPVAGTGTELAGFEMGYLAERLREQERTFRRGGAPVPLTAAAAVPEPGGGPPRFAVGRADGGVELRSADRRPLAVLTGSGLGTLRGLSADPSGRYLAASGGGDPRRPASIAVWDLSRVPDPPPDAPPAAADGPADGPADGRTTAVPPAGRLDRRVPGSAGPFRTVSLRRDAGANRDAATPADATPTLEAAGRVGSLPPGSGLERVRVVRTREDGGRAVFLACGEKKTDDGYVGVIAAWASDGTPLLELTPDKYLVTDVAVSDSGRTLAAVSKGKVFVWPLSRSGAAWTAGSVRAFDGHRVAPTGGRAGAVGEKAPLEGGATCVAFLPDGSIVSGGEDGRLCLWTVRDVAPQQASLARPDAATLDKRADGRASTSRGVSHRAVWAHHRGPEGRPVTAVAAAAVPTPGGKRRTVVVSGGDDAVVRVWDTDDFVDATWTADGRLAPSARSLPGAPGLEEFVGHGDRVNDLALADGGPAGGLLILSVGADGQALTNRLRTVAAAAVAAGDATGGSAGGGDAGSRAGVDVTRGLVGHSDAVVDVRFRPEPSAAGGPPAAAADLRFASIGADRQLILTDRTRGTVSGSYREATADLGRIDLTVLRPVRGPARGVDGPAERVLTADNSGEVLLWDVATRGVVAQFRGGEGPYSPAVSPDGTLLAIPEGPDGMALWRGDVERAAKLFTVTLDGRVTALSFTGDGDTLVGGNDAGLLFTVDLAPVRAAIAAGRDPAALPAPTPTPAARYSAGPIYALAPLPGSGVVAIDSGSRTARVDFANGRGTETRAYRITDVRRGLVAPLPGGAAVGGGFAAVGAGRGGDALTVFRAGDGGPLDRVDLGTAANNVLAVSPDPARVRLVVATKPDRGATNGEARVYELVGGRLQLDRAIPVDVPGGVRAASFTADGNRLLLSTRAGVEVYDLRTDAAEPGRLGGGTFGASLAYSPDGAFLLVGSGDGTFQLFRTAAGRDDADGDDDLRAFTKLPVPLPAADAARAVRAVAFSPAGGTPRFLVAAGTRAWLYELDPSAAPSDAVSAPIALGGDAGTGHRRPLTSAAVSHDGRYAATASEDGSARVWDLSDPAGAPLELPAGWTPPGAVRTGPRGHTGRITAVAFPPVRDADRERAACRADDPEPDDPGVADGDDATGDAAPVAAPAFDPAGRLVLATAGDDDAVVWIVNPPGGNPPGGGPDAKILQGIPLTGHDGAVRDVAFTPDRLDRLFTAGADGTARLWDWNGPAAGWCPAAPAPANDADGLFDPVTEGLLVLADARRGHTGGLTALDVSPDGTAVVTGGEDGRVIVWGNVPPAGELVAAAP